MNDKSADVRLTERDQQILLQAKTDMVTAEVVWRRFFPEGSLEAARSVIRRLCGQAPDHLYLQPEPLDDRRVYYRLTVAGAKLLGIPARHAVPLKRQGKVKRYALSWFLYADRPGTRTLLNPREFPEQFPLRSHSLPRHPFFIEETADRSRLGIILVDHNAHLRRSIHKTLKPLGRFLRHGWFDDYIRAECFAVAILTFTNRRKLALERHLPQAMARQFALPFARLRPDLQGRLPILLQIHVIPGMDVLLTSRATEERKS